MRRQLGFTLIELVVVVLIIAILAAVAIPSYRKYVVRSHRVDAQRALTELAARQERFLYSNNQYADNLGALGGSSSMAGSYYSVSVAGTSSAGTTYSVTATATGSQQQDDKQCQTLSLDQAGRQNSTGTTANDPACWGR
ncbi:MAG: prepilin-type N-terminal cleavage/methylation domain-containing protein [Frateuria sp.]|uniref:type IV pilin protein n=1 Tax=Frateuria sp. TaxID=2211372 RepID=UPI001818B2DD|nr:type IV pilin protein [Frateuria sp.]NUO73961.1 prepilin-type N-terminal cleavage/methylation domain-containing protein [Frateuria sp.]NUR22820.1 prepilin-type N-terminal cleavage/methylation domain-containing protein [Frateuria sp.]